MKDREARLRIDNLSSRFDSDQEYGGKRVKDLEQIVEDLVSLLCTEHGYEREDPYYGCGSTTVVWGFKKKTTHEFVKKGDENEVSVL